MTVFIVAIIVGVVLVTLFIIDEIVGLPLHLGDCLAYGILIDFVVIAISIGILTGWVGFIIAALILCSIFHGIDADTALYFEPHESKRKLAKKKETFKSQQNIRYVRSASVNGPSFGFILVGPDYPPDADIYNLVNGLNDACTGACVLFGESPDDVIKNWEGLAHLGKAEGDHNKRKLYFGHLSCLDKNICLNIQYECRFKHDRLYFVRERRWESKSISHSSMRTPENERKEERELSDWKASYPFINNPEKGFSAIEDGIKLRSNKINAVAVRKKHIHEDDRIYSEWEITTPDFKKIKCICEWKYERKWRGSSCDHHCEMYQEYELIE